MSKVANEAGTAKDGAESALVERPHSRRTLLTGAAVGLAGAAVAAVATSSPAGADGPNILLGNGGDGPGVNGGVGNNAGSNQTSMITDTSAGPAFIVENIASDSTAIYGRAENPSSMTVGSAGVVGDTDADGGFGVAGLSLFGVGVLGLSGGGSGLDTGSGAAVVGDNSEFDGVDGFSLNGNGVMGTSQNASGVIGNSYANETPAVFGIDFSPSGGYGVEGLSGTPDGVGVLAKNTIGTALKVTGTATFSGSAKFARSGVVSIAAGNSTANHAGVNPLVSTSLVLANLQNSLPGVYVEAVVPNVSGHSFEIVLSKAVPAGKTAKVAWFIVN